jgi:hypothetical protein
MSDESREELTTIELAMMAAIERQRDSLRESSLDAGMQPSQAKASERDKPTQTQTAKQSSYADGFTAGFIQAMSAVKRAANQNIPADEILAGLRKHYYTRLQPWRLQYQHNPPPRLRRWKQRERDKTLS